MKGKYDEDGFFILEEGGFYDPEGFYFDKSGFDGIGGYYDEAGQYVAPPGLKDAIAGTFQYAAQDDQDIEYADYYEELMGGESDEGEDDGGIDQAEIDSNVKKEHIFPVIEWLKE